MTMAPAVARLREKAAGKLRAQSPSFRAKYTYAQTAMRKLGAANRTHAVATAIRYRLFDI